MVVVTGEMFLASKGDGAWRCCSGPTGPQDSLTSKSDQAPWARVNTLELASKRGVERAGWDPGWMEEDVGGG